MPASTTGLARVTISSSQRRVDVALPDGVPLAELLPELLRHAGEHLADDGERHGGWLLRRADGVPLTPAAGLASQGIRDGAVLHLVPAREQWPELEYDDVVEAIADGARRYGLGWTGAASRVFGLVAAGVLLLLGLAVLIGAEPGGHGGRPSALGALGAAAVLLLAGVVASRAYSDALAGAVLAGYALPCAFLGGLLLLVDERGPGRGVPAEPQSYLLVGSVALVLAGVVGSVGVGYGLRVFVAGVSAGVLGVLGSLLAYPTSGVRAAAVVLAGLVTGVAAVPLLAIRLGKLPMPVLATSGGPAAGPPGGMPGGPGEEPPERVRVFAAVARTDEMLTGMLLGSAVVAVAASAILVRSAGLSGRLLVGVAAAALLLRARLFVTVRHRLPLFGTGLAAIALLAWPALADGTGTGNLAGGAALIVGALLVAVAGARYAGRAPSPYLGRAADLLDVLCVVSVVPVACAVLGLYALARGIGG